MSSKDALLLLHGTSHLCAQKHPWNYLSLCALLLLRLACSSCSLGNTISNMFAMQMSLSVMIADLVVARHAFSGPDSAAMLLSALERDT